MMEFVMNSQVLPKKGFPGRRHISQWVWFPENRVPIADD